VTRLPWARRGRAGRHPHRRIAYDGFKFDSRAERDRYIVLKARERAGTIRNLVVHPKFELVPRVHPREGRAKKAIVYVADFSYISALDAVYMQVTDRLTDLEAGFPANLVIEDVKVDKWNRAHTKHYTTATPVFRLKAHLMLWRYGLEVTIVPATQARRRRFVP
jgi:hypothetical protein